MKSLKERMKTLQTYIECDLATPANTLGMGNPGEIAQDTLTEPIGVAKAQVEKDKKKRKKKMKSLAESLFDKDIITKDIKFGDLFKLDDVEINEKMEKPSRGSMFPGYMETSKFTLSDMYKTSLLSKDSGQKVNKDPNSIVNALDKLICDIQITSEILDSSLYSFNDILRQYKKYYSSTLLKNAYFRTVAMIWASGSDRMDFNNEKVTVGDTNVIYIDFFHIKLKYTRK